MKKAKTGTAGLLDVIEGKRAALEELAKKAAEAQDNPAALVLIEKKERRTRAELETLETAYNAAMEKPEEPTDKAELLAGLEKYRRVYDDRLQQIRASIEEKEAEAAQIEKDIEAGTSAADVQKVVDGSEKLEQVRATLAHLRTMEATARELPIYPDGAILDEWREICKTHLPKWREKVDVLETLAAAYNAAALDLLAMNKAIKEARKDLGKLEPSFDYAPFFTAGGSYNKMVVNPIIGKDLAGIFTAASIGGADGSI